MRGYVLSHSLRNHATRQFLRVCVRLEGIRHLLYVHAYLESVLRLCLLFLEGFRGNELGMMGVGVQGRLMRARRMQACERVGEEKKTETKKG